MEQVLLTYLKPGIRNRIDEIHENYKKLYGVYMPPTLKQVVSLRNLLIHTNAMEDVDSVNLLKLTRVECQFLIKVLYLNYNLLRKEKLIYEQELKTDISHIPLCKGW